MEPFKSMFFEFKACNVFSELIRGQEKKASNFEDATLRVPPQKFTGSRDRFFKRDEKVGARYSRGVSII